MDDVAELGYPADKRPTAARRRVRIEPPGASTPPDLRELWRYRELLYFFVWRDVKVRYKQTVLGAVWAVVQPFATMVVFTVFFGRLGGMASHVDGSYPVFVYAALLPWMLFAGGVGQAATSLLGSGHLISKVYFPRLLIPASAIATGLVDFFIACCMLGVLMAMGGVTVTAAILYVPVFVAGTLAAAAGTGMLLSALVVAYRDFRYVTGFVIQLWLFASPVVYPLTVVPEEWRLVYALNPMVGMITGFRAACLGEPIDPILTLVSFAVAGLLFIIGVLYFVHVERRFADII